MKLTPEQALETVNGSVKCRVDFTPKDVIDLQCILNMAKDEARCAGSASEDRINELMAKVHNFTPVPIQGAA